MEVKLLPIQEAYRRLFERQAEIAELELHANGHCAHVGKLSPGCLKCFVPDGFYCNIAPALAASIPAKCQVSCPYCPDPETFRQRRPGSRQVGTPLELPLHTARWLRQHVLQNQHDCIIPALSFSGGGDPLMHFELVRNYMDVLKSELERHMPRIPWYFIYTNGIGMTEDRAKQCRDIGLDEVRFHLGASNFSERVYENIAVCAKYVGTVSVETPAWPPHRRKLFEMLPRIDDIGVKHLNLGQVELNPNNKKSILKACPDAEFYQVLSYQMDDGGLVYDLMREIIDKGYSYSVLDCNGLVKTVQRARDYGVWAREVAHDETDLETLVDFERWRKKQARG